jgi:hypothetical protein
VKAIKLLMPLAGLSIVITVASAQNANLNAPVSRQPTVGSEVRRGDLASFDCGIENVIDTEPFIACVNDLIDTNRQKSTLSDPFELGVYLAAINHVAIQDMALNSNHNFPFWRDGLIKLLKKTKLSARDICKAREDTKCDPAQMDKLTFGAFSAAAAAQMKPTTATPAPKPN